MHDGVHGQSYNNKLDHMSVMDYSHALQRLSNHANAAGSTLPEGESFLFALWQADRQSLAPELRGVFEDILACFEVVNHALNTQHPSDTIEGRWRRCRVHSWRMFHSCSHRLELLLALGIQRDSLRRHSAPSLLPCLSRLASRGTLFWQETLMTSERSRQSSSARGYVA